MKYNYDSQTKEVHYRNHEYFIVKLFLIAWLMQKFSALLMVMWCRVICLEII